MKVKLLRIVRLLITVPMALMFVTLIRICRPLLLVRIGALRSDRIGHFVLETDLMILEQRAGISPKRKRTCDIYYAPEPIANRFVYEMWKRNLRIWPNWFMVAAFRVNNFLLGRRAHQVPSTTSTCLDVHNLIDRYPTNLSFTKAEIAEGCKTLAEMGIDEGDRFVCFIVRDSAYTKKVFPGKDLSYHDYRNCDVDDYVLGAEALASRGFFVLRMGSVVSKPLVSNHPRVIDYANSKFRSEFMDVFIGARCEFCVSDGLGFYAIPAAFRRPNAYVNYSPFHMFYSSRNCDLGIAKTLKDLVTNRRLSLSEMKTRGVAGLTQTEHFEKASVSVSSNTPEEIRDLMLEMLDRIDGKWQTEVGDEELQSSFWQKFAEVIGEQRSISHGELRARYGAKFLRDNPDWIL